MNRAMFLGASNLIFEKANELRNNMTPSEMILWGYLKDSPRGHKFRRQHPISNYVADFYCHSLKLIIEVDGTVHENQENQHSDLERQQDLESKGICFLRFTNNEVEKHLENVIQIIENYMISSKNRSAK